ncbi:MAG: hypothetical protein JWP91_569 [Fibrobacteres bacterium]|nr:hypothetical protein [Fibrobacterota bacterium]
MGVQSGFPYFEVEFDKDGDVSDAKQVKSLKAALKPDDPTDLIVISHGWNNDMAEARLLYSKFLQSFRKRLDAGLPGTMDRRFAVLAVLWPSKKFADHDLIPSGAAGLGSSIPDKAILDQIQSLKGFFNSRDADAHLEKAKTLVPKLENSPAAQKEFADLIRSVVDAEAAHGKEGAEDASSDFFKLSGEEVMKRLAKPITVQGTVTPHGGVAGIGGTAMGHGGPAAGPGMGGPGMGHGGAAGIGSFFAGIKAAAGNLLNFTTYYQMKARAGKVGTHGLMPLLRDIKTVHAPLKLHLVGHSFGGRLVTATASSLAKNETNPNAVPVDSLSLLQAAFSHYGFSDKWDGTHAGAFRNVLTAKQVKGPIIATCTVNDKAVGLAYPMASLLAGQVAAGIGDKNDKYGGMGRNGAQMTPETVNGKLLALGKPYEFAAGKVHNLVADEYVKGHSDICGEEVAYAVLAAISRT